MPWISNVKLCVHDSGGPNGICHLVGQHLRFPLKGRAFRT